MILTIISWVITILALIGVILNIRKNRYCFHIWTLTNASWTIIDYIKGVYAQSFLFFIYFCLAIWGIYAWRRKEDK